MDTDLESKQLAPRVGLALSGGGVRATVFHFGVLARLARTRLFDATKFVSTVSGGSLAAGLIFETNKTAWPTSSVYLEEIVPKLRERVTASTLQWSYVWRSVALPWRLTRGRAHVLGDVLRKQWGITGSLDELPKSPRWFINATCYETGKNWRFSQTRMGDYATHYVINPSFPLADAVAASAAAPGLIGPLVIDAREFSWHSFDADGDLKPVEARAKRYELWDGGVYDNLGLEALYKPAGGLRDGMNFLVISDASAPLDFAPRTIRRMLKPGHRALRLVGVATDQVRGLRARSIVAEFAAKKCGGVYLRMGNHSTAIYAAAGVDDPGLDVLHEEAVRAVAGMETTLRRLRVDEFERLFRHGYEVTDATLASRYPGEFVPSTYLSD